MGVSDLKDNFNSIAGPRYTCLKAYLAYEQADGAEWQRLTFSGTAADGTEFSVQSELLPPHTDVNQAARETAQALLDRKEPLS